MKKSLWTRLVSLLLAVVLCVELLPAVGSAVSPSEDLEHTVEGTVEEPAEVAFEEASLRSERVKHFRMGDGSYVAVQYDVPVHHRDADGRWQDIDNTLEPVGQTYVVGIIGLFCSAPIITILGAGLSAAGEISANSNDADPVPEGDFDGYIVTVTWDIPYIELPSSSNTPRLTGYSAQYYVIYCDSFREPFWAIIDYSLFEVYG